MTTFSHPDDSMRPHQRSGFRFLVAGFCFLLGFLNYLDRVVLSFAIRRIARVRR